MNRLNVTVTMRAVNTPPPMPTEAGIFNVRGFGDPFMVEYMGLSTNLEGANFNHVDMWSPTAGWGAVHKFQKLDRQALDYLMSIQPNDESIYGFSFEEKMNWLVGEITDGSNPARPYWSDGARWSGNWKSFRFGTMVFGNQQVKVETNANGKPVEYKFLTSYPSTSGKQQITFYKPVGMKRSEIGKFTHETHPWFIQMATSAERRPRPDSINYRPRGVIYHPIWDLEDWPSNYGSDLYIARETLY
ncbi:MAG TPA: hypothetical protein DCX53_14030 [Anaerolineae bacterium]|nr:hypothetical protein [Anaerolineae bacterium]